MRQKRCLIEISHFVADHPFIYLITSKDTILFCGRLKTVSWANIDSDALARFASVDLILYEIALWSTYVKVDVRMIDLFIEIIRPYSIFTNVLFLFQAFLD